MQIVRIKRERARQSFVNTVTSQSGTRMVDLNRLLQNKPRGTPLLPSQALCTFMFVLSAVSPVSTAPASTVPSIHYAEKQHPLFRWL
jgi:hypothetical protein